MMPSMMRGRPSGPPQVKLGSDAQETTATSHAQCDDDSSNLEATASTRMSAKKKKKKSKAKKAPQAPEGPVSAFQWQWSSIHGVHAGTSSLSDDLFATPFFILFVLFAISVDAHHEN